MRIESRAVETPVKFQSNRALLKANPEALNLDQISYIETADRNRNRDMTQRDHRKNQRPRQVFHDDVIKWKHFPRYWTFVRGIHRSPVNSPHKGQWREALMFSLICAWVNGWVNTREAGDLRQHRTHYDATLMPNRINRGSLLALYLYIHLINILLGIVFLYEWQEMEKWFPSVDRLATLLTLSLILRSHLMTSLGIVLIIMIVGMFHCVTQWTRNEMITSLLRQKDVSTSFWRNNYVIIASCVRWVVLLLCYHMPVTRTQPLSITLLNGH